MWEQGQQLKDGYNILAKEYGVSQLTECIGFSPRTVLTFKDEKGNESLERKSLFQQECIKRGILFSGGQNMCFSHSKEDVYKTLKVYRTVMEIFKDAVTKNEVLKRLEGEPVQAVFRKP
jgi:hypothetical protein